MRSEARAIILLGGLAAVHPAEAGGLKAVVFDMEPANMTMTPTLAQRIKDADALLRKLLAERGLTLVDTAPQAKTIKGKAPLSECNGCDQEIAAALGGEIEVATAVQPLTSSLFSISGSVKDVKTNRVLRAGVVNVTGEQAAEWAHSVKFLVKERLFTPPLPEDATALRKTVENAQGAK